MKSTFYWRMRAEEIRTIADDISDMQSRAMLIRIATGYDRLARMKDPEECDALMTRIGADYAAFTEAGHSHE